MLYSAQFLNRMASTGKLLESDSAYSCHPSNVAINAQFSVRELEPWRILIWSRSMLSEGLMQRRLLDSVAWRNGKNRDSPHHRRVYTLPVNVTGEHYERHFRRWSIVT